MANDSVSPSQFWIGTALTLSAVLVSIWQTRAQMQTQRAENRLTQVASVLKDMPPAIGEVNSSLDAFGGMYVLMRGCLSAQDKQPEDCWNAEYDFDPDAAAAAWGRLIAALAYAQAFVHDGHELALLESVRQIQRAHQEKVLRLIPPADADAAATLADIALATKRQLSTVRDELTDAMSQRVRE